MKYQVQATARWQRTSWQTLVFALLLVMGSGLATAQKEKPRKLAKSPPGANTLITEIAPMLKSRSVRAKGMIIIKSHGSDCREPTYSGEFEALDDPVPEVRVAVLQGPAVLLSFLQGVRHKFIGHICWPGVDSTLTKLKEEGATGGNYRGDTVILDSPISITEGSFVIAAQSRVFDIKSDPSGPLVFEVTLKGYKRISGKGTVRTPNGKTYSFNR